MPNKLKKRGRKVIPLKLPQGEFTIFDIAKLNKISEPNAYIRLHNHHKVTCIKTIPGSKGKPRKVYVINQ